MAATVVVSIGRGTRQGPLSAEAWRRFMGATFLAVAARADVVFHGEGRGLYEDEVEGSYTVIATQESPLGQWRYALEERLADLAKQWHQESIALTITTNTQFVKGV
jgi:hypothetical protein